MHLQYPVSPDHICSCGFSLTNKAPTCSLERFIVVTHPSGINLPLQYSARHEIVIRPHTHMASAMSLGHRLAVPCETSR